MHENAEKATKLQAAHDLLRHELSLLQDLLSRCTCSCKFLPFVSVGAGANPMFDEAAARGISIGSSALDMTTSNGLLGVDASNGLLGVVSSDGLLDMDTNITANGLLMPECGGIEDRLRDFSSLVQCIDDIKGCNAYVQETLADVRRMLAAGIPDYKYVWSLGESASDPQELVLTGKCGVPELDEVVRGVHKFATGACDIPLDEFDIPIPGLSIRWTVSTADDVARASEAMAEVASWFEGVAGDLLLPPPWLETAKRNMRQLRGLCQQYREACHSDGSAALAEFAKLSARKEVFTHSARCLLRRMGAASDVAIQNQCT